jgi:hypothetical protein
MAKHKRTVVTEFPAWIEKSTDACLRSVAEDAYVAQSLAVAYGAPHNSKCVQLMRAGEKSLKKLADTKASSKIRCAEGDRAARKFWEAKVCARDMKR